MGLCPPLQCRVHTRSTGPCRCIVSQYCDIFSGHTSLYATPLPHCHSPTLLLSLPLLPHCLPLCECNCPAHERVCVMIMGVIYGSRDCLYAESSFTCAAVLHCKIAYLHSKVEVLIHVISGCRWQQPSAGMAREHHPDPEKRSAHE